MAYSKERAAYYSSPFAVRTSSSIRRRAPTAARGSRLRLRSTARRFPRSFGSAGGPGVLGSSRRLDLSA